MVDSEMTTDDVNHTWVCTSTDLVEKLLSYGLDDNLVTRILDNPELYTKQEHYEHSYFMKRVVCHDDVNTTYKRPRQGRLVDYNYAEALEVLSGFMQRKASSLRRQRTKELQYFHNLTRVPIDDSQYPQASDSLALLLLELVRRVTTGKGSVGSIGRE
ncbi:other/FunK1 protein kinase [Coprinopsis cinerea AmutBmut pab1-1]|nr:other/FunK1 protein kinase [Coprinopsis cinerea AmutBmut pab1-1]